MDSGVRRVGAASMVLVGFLVGCAHAPEPASVVPRCKEANLAPATDELGAVIARCADGSEGEIQPPERFDGYQPRLSYEAQSLGQPGVLIAQCVSTVAGDLRDCRLLCSDLPSMNSPVLAALGTWTMKPARLCGSPVAVKYRIPVRISFPAPEGEKR